MSTRRAIPLIIICIVSAGLTQVSETAQIYDRRTPIVQAVEKVLPSVVNIQTEKYVRQRPSVFGFPNPLEELLQREYKLEGLGSGVVVEGGYIVTNHHVVQYESGEADTIYVTFNNDDKQHEAVVYGSDPKADVAILKMVDNTQRTGLPWGRSDDLMIGETVIAAGNALGQPFTVTTGIISALNRTIEEQNGNVLFSLIQTNADINRGNSGGPLVNINGDFIGLNTAILTPSGGSVGLGFAIPVSRVKKIYNYWINGIISLEDLMGLSVQELTPPIKEFFRTHYPSISEENLHGVVVLQASPGGLSENVLQRQDVIYSIDDRHIQNSNDLFSRLETHPKDKPLKISILRKGESQTVQIRVPDKRVEKKQWNGMELQTLDTPWRRWMELPEEFTGVVVLSVDPNSQAARAGFKRGDLIQGFGQGSVNDPKLFKQFKGTEDFLAYVQSPEYRRSSFMVVYSRVGKNTWSRTPVQMKAGSEI